MAKKLIPATWQDFDGYGGEKSTYLHAFSEFIDNSIAAYLKEHDQNVSGLQVELNIKTFEENGLANQEITIIDNASGMDDNGLYEAIIPNNKKNKSDTQLNQYGVGMKLASFWFARSLKIVTKERKHKQYFLEINITNENLMDKAEVDIQISRENLIKINNINYDSGTYIKLSNIRTTPNRIMGKSDCEELIKGLGWRYSDLLQKFSLTLNYINTAGQVKSWKVTPFNITPYKLSESIEALSKQKNTIVNSDKYKSLILKNVKTAYLKHKEDIDSITDKNFYETLINNEPLEFTYKCKIEGKNVDMHWGIIALKCTKKNGNYDYTDLSGLTLLNNGRAIAHGPNLSSNFKQTGIHIGTYSLEKKDAGSGQAVYRRLFGKIDLTGIENADRNKTQFNWGLNGEKNLADEADKICSYLKDVLNAMQKAEKDQDVMKEVTNHTATRRIKEKKIWEENFDSSIAIFTPTYDGGNFNIDFGNDAKITFMIQHSNVSKQIAFDIEHDLINQKTVKIKINDDHYLWKDEIHRTDTPGLEFKVKMIYPLAIAFAICKIQYDNKTQSPFSSWAPDELPHAFDKMNFDDWFNKVLEFLSKK